MIKMKRLTLLFAFILLFGTFSMVSAQNGEPPPGAQPFAAPPERPNLLQALGLSRDQVQQLRRLNAELQPQMRQAQRNLKEANEALDEAIYGDDANEDLIRERIRAVQQAHGEVIRRRALMETSIRKILTRDQLVRFRELRQNFQKRQGNRNDPNNPKRIQNPNRTLKRGILRPNGRPPL
jgi:Spy/CpxP family protein refolding chaperone